MSTQSVIYTKQLTERSETDVLNKTYKVENYTFKEDINVRNII